MTATLVLAAAMAVRNPFWPIGYDGTRETISADPIVDVRTSAASGDDDTATAAMAANTSQSITPRQWIAARKSLRIGGTVVVTDVGSGGKRQCVMINGLAYGNGDLISTNHKGRRFTWRVQGLTEGETIKLKRIRAKILEEDDIHKEKSK